MAENIKKILLLISTTRESEKSVKKALEVAESNQAELLILFVLDDELSQEVVGRVSEEGWFGGKPSERLQNAILKEYFGYGNRKIKEIEDIAKERGIKYRSISARGKFAEVALRVIQHEQVDLIIVTRRRRSVLSRFIFGSPVADLKKQSNVEIEIIDE